MLLTGLVRFTWTLLSIYYSVTNTLDSSILYLSDAFWCTGGFLHCRAYGLLRMYLTKFCGVIRHFLCIDFPYCDQFACLHFLKCALPICTPHPSSTHITSWTPRNILFQTFNSSQSQFFPGLLHRGFCTVSQHSTALLRRTLCMDVHQLFNPFSYKSIMVAVFRHSKFLLLSHFKRW